MKNFTFGGLIGFVIGGVITLAVFGDFVKSELVMETQQECNIDKPSGTICKWEATWKPVSVDKGE